MRRRWRIGVSWLIIAVCVGSAMATATPIGAVAAPVRVRKVRSPRLTLTLPATVLQGARIQITGRLYGAPGGARVVTEWLRGRLWVPLASTHVTGGHFDLHVRLPASTATVQIRAGIFTGRRRLGGWTIRSVKLTRATGQVKGAGPTMVPAAPAAATPASTTPEAPTLPTSSGPPVAAPLRVKASPLSVAVGSLEYVQIPAAVSSLMSVQEVSASPGALVAAGVDAGALMISAAANAAPGSTTVTVHATGCATSGCGQPVEVEVPVTVLPLQAPSGELESLTEPSPERASEGTDSFLEDELVITIGSPEDPGSRAQAEVAAKAVEAVVSGGIEGSGIYQLRWTSHQDLGNRRQELEDLGLVTSVSFSSVGSYEPAETFPVAPQFDIGIFSWPYKQVHASEAWAQATGADVTVGVIDEADVYRDHEDLDVVESIGPYVPPLSSGAGDPAHASHVAGLACARNNVESGGGSQLGMVGLGWGCPIVTAATRSISSDTMLNIMHKMASRPSVRVVNISLGRNVALHKESNGTTTKCANQTIAEEIEQENEKEAPQFRAFLDGREGRKIVWVSAAGNDCAPLAANAWGAAGAALRNVITVAATNSNETLAEFSDYGSGVKVAAPGGFAISSTGQTAETNGLMSSVPGVLDCPYSGYCPAYLCLAAECSEYEEMAGTSMASPIVAGTATLVAEHNPSLSAEQIATCVTGSAGTAGAPGGPDYANTRSNVHPSSISQYIPVLPEGEPLPIIDAAAAVECKHRHTAATFRGSGGGDGWAVALTGSAVYNVFHHSSQLSFACHYQATAESCYEPETITDGEGNGFATSGQPGLQLDQSTGRLYVFATRTSDQTGGVVCIDTAEAFKTDDPFCGFTPLTGVGEASSLDGISAISNGALVGTRWYAFNYYEGAGVAGTENKLLCFDLATKRACSGQPFSVGAPAGDDEDTDLPPPAVVAIGSSVIVPLQIGEAGNSQLACLEGNSESPCAGNWPVATTERYDSSYGAAFPLLNGTDSTVGFCLPTGGDPCYGLDGKPVATPANLGEAIAANSGWNGPAVTLGSRVYVPDGDDDSVECYDYGNERPCAGYPVFPTGLDLLYTVNPDPERPGCLWMNSDNGEAQIQTLEAATGSSTCE